MKINELCFTSRVILIKWVLIKLLDYICWIYDSNVKCQKSPVQLVESSSISSVKIFSFTLTYKKMILIQINLIMCFIDLKHKLIEKYTKIKGR